MKDLPKEVEAVVFTDSTITFPFQKDKFLVVARKTYVNCVLVISQGIADLIHFKQCTFHNCFIDIELHPDTSKDVNCGTRFEMCELLDLSIVQNTSHLTFLRCSLFGSLAVKSKNVFSFSMSHCSHHKPYNFNSAIGKASVTLESDNPITMATITYCELHHLHLGTTKIEIFKVWYSKIILITRLANKDTHQELRQILSKIGYATKMLFKIIGEKP